MDLIYTFYISNNKFGLLESVQEIITKYREDFNNPSMTLRELCFQYLKYEKVKNECDKVLKSLEYSDQQIDDYIQTLSSSKYPNYFDYYYMDRYGMTRSELLEKVRVRTINEEKDDFDYEKNSLLLKDERLCLICNLEKSYNEYFQKLLTIFVEATLGGLIARVVYEKLNGELSKQPHDLSDIQNKIYIFREKIENDYYIELDTIILQLFEMFI